MPAEAWVVIGGVVLAVMAGSFWYARQYDRTAATYQKQIDAANELHRRSLALLDRQEELLGRAESLMERLEKQRDSV
jgi:hypothetical protein